MRTVGVDLAAEAKGTALAVIDWRAGSARLESLRVGVDDAVIVEAAGAVAKLGIDCALGWPDAFVEFVSAHAAGAAGAGDGASIGAGDSTGALSPVDGGMAWRRTLAYRETDRHAREVTGRWPLSVSTDRLGLTAMRCAGLLARLRDAGHDVDRAGSGLVAEVYPGASLRLWGFDTTGYRTDAVTRRALVADLTAQTPWLDLNDHEESMTASADAFDAVIACLAARAAALGRSSPPPAAALPQARREGWIALPTAPLGALVEGA